ncbi:DUF4440 domain-containing protein [Saccharopolyspora cebuensis]|uniref:DUF4440 domain-containing protein n=1 Tax=Saccharopolyspora cebuensis TaxID=418759 RepID=A0ABV4CM36_9PSEU
MDPVLAELAELEPLFHRGTTLPEVEAMIAPDFREIGASGRTYSREHVIAVLAERFRNPVPERWETDDFRRRELAPGLHLLTYALRQGDRLTQRATLWQRTPDGWQVRFHQGTVVTRTGTE